ncbi:50S ribosomal protein L25 [Rickettsiales bacterium]|nr:50S ribosomal protein L25 [Rickettsiales bacterium]
MEISVAEPREIKTRGHLNKLREQGKIPAVIYGGSQAPAHITVTEKEFTKKYLQGQLSSALLMLQIKNKAEEVLVKDIQIHPVSGKITHVDFQRKTDSEIKTTIFFEFINSNKCPGLKMGGILKIIRKSIKVFCSPESIISVIKVDLSTAKKGSKIAIKDLDMPAGVRLVGKHSDILIAKISGKRAGQKTEDADAQQAEQEQPAE